MLQDFSTCPEARLNSEAYTTSIFLVDLSFSKFKSQFFSAMTLVFGIIHFPTFSLYNFMLTDMFSNIFLKWLLGNHTWFTPKVSLENVGKRPSALDQKKLQL